MRGAARWPEHGADATIRAISTATVWIGRCRRGRVVDGASIPSVFWSIIGAPYTGKYRDASVIHDYYCETHRGMEGCAEGVLDGMLARGVGSVSGENDVLGCLSFLCRWDYDADACFCEGCPACANPKIKKIKSYEPNYRQSDFEALKSKAMEPGTTWATWRIWRTTRSIRRSFSSDCVWDSALSGWWTPKKT